MSLTLKETNAEPESLTKGGPSVRNQSSRSNPVCLEVPITILTVPAEGTGAAAGATQSREEGRTVIVFEHGAVLRLSSNIPAGQTLILSNPQGREAVCRVINARNLPSIKGYVEVEFVETLDDFWGINSAESSAASVPQSGGEMSTGQQEFARALTAANAPVSNTASEAWGGAPTFEDVEDVVDIQANQVAAQPASERKPAPVTEKSVAKVVADDSKRIDAASKNIAPKNSAPVHDLGTLSAELAASLAELATSPKVQQPETPVARPAVTATPSKIATAAKNEGMLGSSVNSGMVAAGEPRSKAPLIVGGLAILMVGLAGGYFFFNRGSERPTGASSTVPVAQVAASQPIAATTMTGSPGSVAAGAIPSTAAQPSASLKPTNASSVSASAQSATAGNHLSGATPVSPQVTATAPNQNAEQARTIVRQPEHDLKMHAPAAANRNNAAKNADLSASAVPDIAAPAMVMGMPSGSSIPAAPRPDAAPAAPAAASASVASDSKVMREPKLISTVRPVYPELAKQSNIQGAVLLSVEIDATGNVVGTKAISGPMFLRQAAMEAVKKWKYSPALSNGKPVAAELSVNVAFQLSK